ncbi:MAG: monomethylamine:corrinoid methyltransferase [Desulfurococcaceae archaeon]|jgi:hypothetical protein|nr:monomethylamine:corrinoid methyltransferase [Desulfurococcaceae archaeon]
MLEYTYTLEYMPEKDFDRLLMKTVRDIIKQRKLKIDYEGIIAPEDIAKEVFEAGVELLLRVGVFNVTTSQRILFSEESLKDALKSLPLEIKIGEGKDQRTLKPLIYNCEPIICEAGPSGTLVSSDIYFETMSIMASGNYIDAVGSGSINILHGREVKVRHSLEIDAAIFIAQTTRNALRYVGKSGLHINDVAITTPWAKIAAINREWGIRSSDSVLVAQMIELKTSEEHLSLAKSLNYHGIIVGNLMTPILGGYGGGVIGTAIISVAEHIAGVLIYNALKHYLSLTHIYYLNNTTKDGLRTISLVGQALKTRSKIISLYDCYTFSGGGTRELLLEVVAGAIVAKLSGLHGTGIGVAGGRFADQATGLESDLMCEVMKKMKITRKEDAEDVLKKIIDKYEYKILEKKKVERGKSIHELYDLKTLKPKDLWLKEVNLVRRELEDMGLIS